MRIKVSQLRSLIQEVGMSPSIRNNKPMQGPFDSKNVAELTQKLEAAFQNALVLDMVVRAFDKHYNDETREFDDDVYQNIKQIVDDAKDRAAGIVKEGLESVWVDAHKTNSNGPSSQVRPRQAA